MFLWYFGVFLLSFFTLLIWDYWSKKERNRVLRYMPGPKALPILGNIFLYRGLDAEEIMEFIFANSRKYGSIYRVWIMRQLAVFSSDPQDLEVVLSSPHLITKNNLYELLTDWLGTGLLLSTGKKWHQRRRIITPTFHFNILEQFVEIFQQQTTTMIEKLQNTNYINEDKAINIYPYICSLALDIITESAMGVKINAQNNPDFPYTKAVATVTNIITKRFINIWTRIKVIFYLFHHEDYKALNQSISIMHNFTENIILERRRTLDNKAKDGVSSEWNEKNEFGQKRRMALLDVLLQATVEGVPLSNADIREEVDTFMFEGHDTTTSAICFTLHLISRHPTIQKKVVEEINEVLPRNDERPVTLRDLNELKYLECVIKESLRLYPPVPIIGRYITEDVEICGKKIPAGTNYTIGLFVSHRNPKYFDEPNAFKPERFMGENVSKVHPYVYVPFSAGPRNCIGQKFAMLEMKSIISRLLKNFELLPLGPEVRPMMNLILRSANGCHLGLKSRSV